MFSQNSSVYGVIMESGSWNPIDVEISPNCPRCGSTNTKFCYYNNYSLIQPRYFCKGCKRYWTKGGSLRNIPVGGGCRKSRKSKFGHRCSRSLPVGTSSGHDQRFTSRLSGSSGSVTGSGDSGRGDGCNIDIASVYSNFLNPKPEPEPQPEPEFPQVSYNTVSPLFNYFSNFHDEENVHMEFLVESRNLLSGSDYPSNDDENGLNFYGFDSTEEGHPDIINHGFMGMINVNNYVLPPLPDVDVMSDGLVWPSCDTTQSGQDPNQVSDQNESLLGGTSTYGIFSGPGK